MTSSSQMIDQQQDLSADTGQQASALGLRKIAEWVGKNWDKILSILGGMSALKEFAAFITGNKSEAYNSLSRSAQIKVDGLRQSLNEVISSPNPDRKEAVSYLNSLATIYENQANSILDPEKAKQVREMGQSLRKIAKGVADRTIEVQDIKLSNSRSDLEAHSKSADKTKTEFLHKSLAEEFQALTIVALKVLGLDKLDDGNINLVASKLLELGVPQNTVVQALTYYFNNVNQLSAAESTSKANEIVDQAMANLKAQAETQGAPPATKVEEALSR